jgi:NTE family protein
MNIKLLFIVNLFVFVKPFNQLSFSGGGSFGAIEIGILKRVIELNKNIKYDLYTGISAGALNACVLSYYDDIELGIKKTESIYSSINNKMIYSVFPNTGISLLNTIPLQKTLTNIIGNMSNKPLVRTLIGATNMYTGKLDIYNFQEENDINKVLLLMSSCAIPGIFPPVKLKNQLYADGGTLSNQLIEVEHDFNYLNITFITPYEDVIYNNNEIKTLKQMLCRTMTIILNNYNSPITLNNQNCKKPIGEINKYNVPPDVLKGYNILNFNNCGELVDIGYKNVIHKKYIIC